MGGEEGGGLQMVMCGGLRSPADNDAGIHWRRDPLAQGSLFKRAAYV